MINGQKIYEENISNIALADGLALLGIRASAGTVMTRIASCI